jgi:hydrogenase maturation protein HypF
MDQVASGKERRQLLVSGIVQGVGFRPLVYLLAVENHVTGSVCNQLGKVSIEIEGTTEQIYRFIQDLQKRVVEPAKIESIEEYDLPLAHDDQFIIKASEASGQFFYSFPPDLAICHACLTDLTNSTNRYCKYPFTSCIHCGPRYTIIQSLPYDRPNTSMNSFPFCETCQREYEDPGNRRFHAQTIACPNCGPTIELRNNRNILVPGNWQRNVEKALIAGKILAVKGLGGFHLICDASQAQHVETLRSRKRRPRKPFALMARDLKTVEQHFELTPMERETITSRRAPIVLLKPKPILREILPMESLAPGHHRLGIMLPYTPMHALLFSDSMLYLVATSGNQSGFPIAKTNEEAYQQLQGIADLFVLHNREIVIRVEDSVCQVIDEQISFIRRSRGYVPETISFPKPSTVLPTVLAVGAEMKNTSCFLHRNEAILSQHMGEIENEEQFACWREGVRHIQGLFGAEPDIIAYDPHPGYRISQEALHQFADKIFIPVSHHHAHMTACMAEHGLTSPVIGCILDGTGFGRDGRLWGFEILTGDLIDFERVYHLQPLKLPGGEAAIRFPWMMAVSLFYELAQNMALTEKWALQFFPDFVDQLPLLLAQLDGRIPCPKASSAGRLFDAIAAMLGLCSVCTYEGEAAILLGEKADTSVECSRHLGSYSFECKDGQWIIAPLVKEILEDLHQSVSTESIAQKFHHTVAAMICEGVSTARKKTGMGTVVLSGGVWNNRYLLSSTKKGLEDMGFQVYTHQKIPAGDGGIAYGQAVSALWRWHRNVSGSSGEDY